MTDLLDPLSVRRMADSDHRVRTPQCFKECRPWDAGGSTDRGAFDAAGGAVALLQADSLATNPVCLDDPEAGRRAHLTAVRS